MSSSQSSSQAGNQLPVEGKTFEQVQVGEIILGPTPGIQQVAEKINFLYSQSSRQGSQMHSQLVVGKDEERKELITVVVTTLGMIGDKGEKDIWDRHKRHRDGSRKYTKEEWGAGLQYLIPLEPTTYRKEDVDRYDQPELQIRYAEDTQIRYPPQLLRWASVPHMYKIRPKADLYLPGSAGNGGKAGKSASISGYLVKSGLKFNQDDCAWALAYAKQREVLPHYEPLAGGAKGGPKAPEAERIEEDEGEDGWTTVSGKGKGKGKKGGSSSHSHSHHRRR